MHQNISLYTASTPHTLARITRQLMYTTDVFASEKRKNVMTSISKLLIDGVVTYFHSLGIYISLSMKPCHAIKLLIFDVILLRRTFNIYLLNKKIGYKNSNR